jgi:hypothetical protein
MGEERAGDGSRGNRSEENRNRNRNWNGRGKTDAANKL